MTTSSVIVLLAAVILVCVGAIVATAAVVVWYSIRQLPPYRDLVTRVLNAESEMAALDRQVAKLRTSKAGRISNEKRRDEVNDPDLADLTPEERSLFM